MVEQEKIRLKSKLIIFIIFLTVFTFLIGLLAVLFSGAIQETISMFQRTEPIKLHVYSYLYIVVQTVLYSLLLFIPSFLITSAIYPLLPMPERVVLSLALASLLYGVFVNMFIAIIKLQPFVSAQIFWELSYSVISFIIGLIAWLVRLSRIKK